MPRLLGLAQASKLYRKLNVKNSEKFSKTVMKLHGELSGMQALARVFF